jgi:methyl-accepting chemotaxis protein
MAKSKKVIKATGKTTNSPFTKTAIIAIVAFLLGSLTWYIGKPQKTEVAQNQVQNLVGFVNSAATLVETKGEGAFTDFRQKDSEWWKGDQYIFVYDMNANTLVLPPSPEVEGTNRWTTQDSNGVFYVREMIQQLQNKNYTWVMYSYPKPGEKAVSSKVAYVKKVTLGNETVLIGSGVYY